MSQIAPPPEPPAAKSADENPLYRIHFRLWQICMTAVTILVNGWLFTLSIPAGIIALFFAKHVLVAVLATGLSLPPAPPDKRNPQAPR